MCAFQVNEGFWRRPPQTWLGNTSKIRVLDPYFQLQTAKLLLRIPVHSTTVREAELLAAER